MTSTTNDKELMSPKDDERMLLELAAKAAGWNEFDWLGDDNYMDVYDDDGHQSCWNPLTDDGDALRLAVKLNLNVLTSSATVVKAVYPNEVLSAVSKESDTYAATRRAIVRAAASIGEKL